MKNLYIILLLTFGLGQDYSLQFDGVDDYVDIADNDILDIGTSDFTIQFWIKTNDVNRAHIISKSIGSGQSDPTHEAWYFIYLDNNENVLL